MRSLLLSLPHMLISSFFHVPFSNSPKYIPFSLSSLTSLHILPHSQTHTFMAETLWDLEDKLRLSTQGALLILASACFSLAAICTFIVLKRKARKNRIAHQEGDIGDGEGETSTMEQLGSGSGSKSECNWISVKHVLMGLVQWSRACKWKENVGSQRNLLGLERNGGEIGRQSHNSVSAVWQRPILRGEKCELPRFSGLILYDEKGRLLRHSEEETNCNGSLNQEITIGTVRTTLRDLLSS